MASFTDQLINFNPYTSQLPVDDYVRVGMIKQQQYDQGVQKVQGYINSIAGIEVVKPEHQDYLQKRVNQLQGEVSTIIGQDFSNQQLQNSVGTLTSKIASDPIIRTAVASTQRYQAGLSAMKAARDKGASSPSNEWAFQNQFQRWVSDRDVSTTFGGEYVPYTDINKKVLATIKELDPTSTLEDIPYKRGEGGNILIGKDGLPEIDFAMVQKSTKGVSPERIAMALRATLDSNDMRQLQIDGSYQYRGMDKYGMKQIADDSYTYRLNQINDTIKGLMVDRQTNISDQAHVAAVDAKIQALQDRGARYQEDYKKDIASLDADPEAFKGNTYMQNYIAKFSEGYAYAENALTYKENPYFMAAERRRENDIKFQEFMLNKQFEAARIGIDQERLNLQKAELDLKKTEAKKKKDEEGGDDAPLPLAQTIVREPINQDNLEKINTSTFLNETQAASDMIDSQKMALLAQTRPDLVHVVRDPDGTNARYEYNVLGKNPNLVKNEAEATILKLKDSYDRGEEVEDGVKTYFDNLGTTSQKIENRKSAFNKIQTEADVMHNIAPALKKVQPLSFTSGSGTKYTVSPDQMMQFNEKMQKIQTVTPGALPGDLPVTGYDDDAAQQLLTSPAERVLYSIIKKGRYNDAERTVVNRLQDVVQKVNVPNKSVIQAKNAYTDNAVRDIVGATQPVAFQVKAFKAEDRARARAVINDLVTGINRAGKSNEGAEFDEKNIKKMISKDAEANTTYSLISNGGDNYSLRLSNADVTDVASDISITKAQAVDLFGQGQFLDDFQAIREALQLSKSQGKVTTDVQGAGRESAFTVRNGQLNNYGVKYHVEDPLKNGGLQVRLYIFDKEDKTWKETTANFGTMLNEAQVTKFISRMDDSYIDALLKKTK